MTRVKVWLFAVVLVGGALGCGGDDDDGDDTPVAGTMTTGGTGMATGGTGGATGGTTATGGGGGTGATAMPVACGSNMCNPISLGGFMLPGGLLPDPCCVDAATGECGFSMAGGACMAPPPSDERCPAPSGSPLPISTCCAANGMCGASLGGMCFDTSNFASFLGTTPMVCDESLAGGGDDAGTDEDAGI